MQDACFPQRKSPVYDAASVRHDAPFHTNTLSADANTPTPDTASDASATHANATPSPPVGVVARDTDTPSHPATPDWAYTKPSSVYTKPRTLDNEAASHVDPDNARVYTAPSHNTATSVLEKSTRDGSAHGAATDVPDTTTDARFDGFTYDTDANAASDADHDTPAVNDRNTSTSHDEPDATTANTADELIDPKPNTSRTDESVGVTSVQDAPPSVDTSTLGDVAEAAPGTQRPDCARQTVESDSATTKEAEFESSATPDADAEPVDDTEAEPPSDDDAAPLEPPTLTWNDGAGRTDRPGVLDRDAHTAAAESSTTTISSSTKATVHHAVRALPDADERERGAMTLPSYPRTTTSMPRGGASTAAQTSPRAPQRHHHAPTPSHSGNTRSHSHTGHSRMRLGPSSESS